MDELLERSRKDWTEIGFRKGKRSVSEFINKKLAEEANIENRILMLKLSLEILKLELPND